MPRTPRSQAPEAPDVRTGDVVLERYRVVEQIGSGGHSVVFKGEDERLSRPVCIKLFSGLGGDTGLGRTSYEHFVQEAFALSRLTHPNTLRIFDFGHLGPKDAPGLPVQVCEYMNGGTLSTVVREQGALALDETARIASALCAALSEAHALGIVHRDIKPQNILFGSVGATRLPKLADFGIAKWHASADEHRLLRADDTAVVAGQQLAMYSPSWAAPEQLAGNGVTPVTDVYSLACVAVYMLSGKAIFADPDVYAGYHKRRHADQLVHEALTPLGTPSRVRDLLARALSFEPERRVESIDRLAAELQAALSSSTIGAALTAPAERDVLTPSYPRPDTDGITQPIEVPLAAATGMTASPRASGLPTDSHAPRAPYRAPPADLTPATYHAPPNVQAWMDAAPAPAGAGPAPRLALAEPAEPIGGRRVSFVMITGEFTDLAASHGVRVRVTLMPAPTGRVVHVKGLTCFVAPLGGRPSPALYVDRSTDVALFTPRAQEIGHLRIAVGTPQSGQTAFQLGAEAVGLATDDCGDPVLFDFGPGSTAYFVYTQGRALPRSGRRG